MLFSGYYSDNRTSSISWHIMEEVEETNKSDEAEGNGDSNIVLSELDTFNNDLEDDKQAEAYDDNARNDQLTIHHSQHLHQLQQQDVGIQLGQLLSSSQHQTQTPSPLEDEQNEPWHYESLEVVSK